MSAEYIVRLPASCRGDIDAHAERAFPEECCGFLLGRDLDDGSREVIELFSVENQKDENRERRYLIEPKHQLAAEKHARTRGLDVVGVYHSHPNHPSRPSEFDREHAMPFWSYVIVSCMQGKCVMTQSWRLTEDRSRFDEETLR